mmetsp:Transcript_13308/g.42716  ORF Transcript_13308/g.42716 Transcript_13308/m.42716 type:complete len:232 (-) Transcript_13308:592-1287(-)
MVHRRSAAARHREQRVGRSDEARLPLGVARHPGIPATEGLLRLVDLEPARVLVAPQRVVVLGVVHPRRQQHTHVRRNKVGGQLAREEASRHHLCRKRASCCPGCRVERDGERAVEGGWAVAGAAGRRAVRRDRAVAQLWREDDTPTEQCAEPEQRLDEQTDSVGARAGREAAADDELAIVGARRKGLAHLRQRHLPLAAHHWRRAGRGARRWRWRRRRRACAEHTPTCTRS